MPTFCTHLEMCVETVYNMFVYFFPGGPIQLFSLSYIRASVSICWRAESLSVRKDKKMSTHVPLTRRR